MIIFKKARSARQTRSDLDAYLTLNGGELSRWLAREVQSWGEYSYAELENLIMTGSLNDIMDWQSRWAEVINERFTPAWQAAMAAAAIKATKGKVILDDSDVDVKNFLRTRGGELITVLSDESKKAVAMVILRGQAEKVLPKKIAQQIRPLIGLNERQAQANMTYRQRVYQNLLASGLPPVTAEARAAKAALRYAGKQHRERADMIVNTELAFAYNRGADIGIKRAIKDGFMGRCEMVWATAGTNRVCQRCLALKDKVVGHTDEDGVTLPPLHPRCRCAIMYREVAEIKPRSNEPDKPQVPPKPPKQDGFVFDLQRFGTYEDQVASHGGSGKVKPDRVIEGHERTPSKTEPLSIIDHKDYKGIVDKRIYYDANGQPYFEINTTNHGNAKNHPYGENGEHAHDIKWANGKAQRGTRELSSAERKDNGDIL